MSQIPCKLHQIVRLRELLKRWRRKALRKAHSFSDVRSGSSSSSSSSSRLRSLHTRRSLSLPSPASSQGRVPAGHLAVYIGEEKKRFVIKMSYLSHPLFKALLKKTEEEMGFHHEGALAIPCHVLFFEHLLHLIHDSHHHHHHSHHHHNIINVLHRSSSPRSHHHRRRHSEDYPLQPHYQELLQELLHLSSQLDSTHPSSSSYPASLDSYVHHHSSSPSLCNLTHSLSTLDFSSVNGASHAVLA